MKPGGGHRKGASFERRICRTLSRWLTHGKRDDLFWRTAISGGSATTGLKSGISRPRQAGDVGLIDPEGRRLLDLAVVEVKALRDFQIKNLMVGAPSKLMRIWAKADSDARQYNRRALVICKQNRTPVFCMIDPSIAAMLGLIPHHTHIVVHHGRRPDFIIIRFDEFLKSDPNRLPAVEERVRLHGTPDR